MQTTTPPLIHRVTPLLIVGWGLAATRLTLDAVAPDAPWTMRFGLYYGMPIPLLWIGFTYRWGGIRWGQLALTMLVVGFAVWGVWNSISYTIGQFMEWTHGRYYPGEPTTQPDGTVEWVGARNSPPAESAAGKVGAGLLHGLISSVASTVWCTVLGTLFIWLPARIRFRNATAAR